MLLLLSDFLFKLAIAHSIQFYLNLLEEHLTGEGHIQSPNLKSFSKGMSEPDDVCVLG